MDVAGLVLNTSTILISIYKYGKDVKDAKTEVNQLCSELFGLRSALQHLQANIEACGAVKQQQQQRQGADSTQHVFSSPHFKSKEFEEMLASTRTLLADLLKRLEKPRSSSEVGAFLHKMTWPFKKSDIKDYMKRLEKLKAYFILTTTTETFEISRNIYLEVCSVSDRLKAQQDERELKAENDFRRSVRQWLAPFDSTVLHKKALSVHQAHTGKWFLENQLQDWFNDSSSTLLWLRGKPGVGKTTLLSAAVSRIEEEIAGDPDTAAAFFYCSFTDLTSQDPANILGSFLAQLCNKSPPAWAEVDSRYRKENSKGDGPAKGLGLEDVKRILEDVLRTLSTAVLFLDAPNESNQSDLIISSLLDVAQKSRTLRLVVSSTEELDIPAVQQGNLSPVIVNMGTKEIDDDIRDYINAWLEQHERLQLLPLGLKEEIKSTLIGKADGMFRWVQCQMESIAILKTPRDIKNALHGVPRTLEQTYSQILTRISKEDRDLARRALFWLTFALRALSFSELCEAVVFDEGDTTIDDDARMLQPEDLLRICRSLISYNPERRQVVLAHSSVRTYLTSDQIKQGEAAAFFLDEEEAQPALARRCLTYLCFSDFSGGYCSSIDELALRWERWPLLSYAARAWPSYARLVSEQSADIDKTTQAALMRFFKTAKDSRSGNFGAWVQAFMPHAKLDIEGSTPLYYASRFGLLSVVKMILTVEGATSLEIRGGRRGSTPLHVASAFGHEEIVNLLLGAGADPLEHNEREETGLQWTARYGDDAIVRTLLAAGADANQMDPLGRTALYFAVALGHEECAIALLEGGADISTIEDTDLDPEDSKEFLEFLFECIDPRTVLGNQ